MELLKSIIIDFCLFSLIEGYIFCLFFEKIGGCKKFKWWQILILAFGNCIISQIFPPIIYQLLMILWMSVVLLIITKNQNNLKYAFYSMIFILIVEMNICFLYEYIINIDFSKLTNFRLFIINIPLKIIEMVIIEIFFKKILKKEEVSMKAWAGEVVR